MRFEAASAAKLAEYRGIVEGLVAEARAAVEAQVR